MREAATKSLRSVDHRESSTKNRREKQQLLAALRAIAEGYPVERSDDRYITVENPDYRPHDGSDPSICIDIHRVKEWLTKG